MGSVRYFTNELLDYSPNSAVSILSIKNNGAFCDKIVELVNYLNCNISKLSSTDISIYTGLPGIALFYKHLLVKKFPNEDLLKFVSSFFDKLVERCLKQVDRRSLRQNVSVFTSSIGPLLIGALCRFDDESSSTTSRQCYEEIINAHVYACDLQSKLPDEALYGRTGYLNSLLMLKEANYDVPLEVVKSVVTCILKSGVRLASVYRSKNTYYHLMHSSSKRDLLMPPLMFEWYDTVYLGGAHGFTGILNTFLKVYNLFPNAISKEDLCNLIMPTVNWMGKLQQPSGNWPCNLGRGFDEDALIHWCHGAPGTISLMLSAFKISNHEEYLKRALAGGEVVWSRGLLRKGCGLCHGTAGSGYALLEIYQLTRDPKYLHRAFKFAEWCADCLNRKDRLADCPFSLFEGIAGTLYFLVDMLDPDNAQFPLLNGV